MSKYYFFKFPKKEKDENETQYEYWIFESNVVRHQALVVYFGESEISDIRGWAQRENEDPSKRSENIKELDRKKKGGRNLDDLLTFYEACNDPQESRFLVSNVRDQHRTLLLFKPTGELKDLENGQLQEYHKKFPQHSGDKPKYVCVEQVGEPIDRLDPKTPAIIATLDSDQALNRGTCNELRSEQAESLEVSLGLMDLSTEIEKKPSRLLKYLSPVQFETLVFLNFHERNFHCQAHRGSTVARFDFRVERTAQSLDDFLSFDGKQMIAVQVKRKPMDQTSGTLTADLVISLEDDDSPSKHPRVRGATWLLQKTTEERRCFEWLKKELAWTGLGEEGWGRIKARYRRELDP